MSKCGVDGEEEEEVPNGVEREEEEVDKTEREMNEVDRACAASRLF